MRAMVRGASSATSASSVAPQPVSTLRWAAAADTPTPAAVALQSLFTLELWRVLVLEPFVVCLSVPTLLHENKTEQGPVAAGRKLLDPAGAVSPIGGSSARATGDSLAADPAPLPVNRYAHAHAQTHAASTPFTCAHGGEYLVKVLFGVLMTPQPRAMRADDDTRWAPALVVEDEVGGKAYNTPLSSSSWSSSSSARILVDPLQGLLRACSLVRMGLVFSDALLCSDTEVDALLFTLARSIRMQIALEASAAVAAAASEHGQRSQGGGSGRFEQGACNHYKSACLSGPGVLLYCLCFAVIDAESMSAAPAPAPAGRGRSSSRLSFGGVRFPRTWTLLAQSIEDSAQNAAQLRTLAPPSSPCHMCRTWVHLDRLLLRIFSQLP